MNIFHENMNKCIEGEGTYITTEYVNFCKNCGEPRHYPSKQRFEEIGSPKFCLECEHGQVAWRCQQCFDAYTFPTKEIFVIWCELNDLDKPLPIICSKCKQIKNTK
jgi:hypothetical protein